MHASEAGAVATAQATKWDPPQSDSKQKQASSAPCHLQQRGRCIPILYIAGQPATRLLPTRVEGSKTMMPMLVSPVNASSSPMPTALQGGTGVRGDVVVVAFCTWGGGLVGARADGSR